MSLTRLLVEPKAKETAKRDSSYVLNFTDV